MSLCTNDTSNHKTIPKKEISRKKPIEYNSYCGSYLPEWRPNIDYRDVYSARKEFGGGVHLDLIHEVDYCRYLLGNPKESFNYGRKKSDLEISSIDIAHYVFEYDSTSAFITLNYYRRVAKRVIECVWDDKIWVVDLLSNTIVNSEGKIIYTESYDVLDTYMTQMKKFIHDIQNDLIPENNIEEGIETLNLVLNG